MLNKPEEFIMAVLAGLWVVLTYFVADYTGMPTHTVLLITALTLIWAAVLFLLWQRNRVRLIWPCFLGLLIACWWPLFDWLAVKDVVNPAALGDTIIVARPWYATWTAKFIYALIPTLLAYVVLWKLKHQPAKHQITP